MIWKRKFTADIVNERCKNTLCDHIDISFTEIGENFLIAQMPVNEKTRQPEGIVHGGATAALAETVGSAAAALCVDETKLCVGLELNINHIRAAREGVLKARAEPLHLGKSTQVWEIKIWNETGQLISAARLTVAVLNRV